MEGLQSVIAWSFFITGSDQELGSSRASGIRKGSKPPPHVWTRVLEELGVDLAAFKVLSESRLDLGRRVYGAGSYAYKVTLREYESTDDRRKCDLKQEYELLRSFPPMLGVPKAVDYCRLQDADVLIMGRIEGRAWEDVPLSSALVTFPRVLLLLHRLSQQGIVHGDVKAENLLLDQKGNPWLVDFDQAQRSSVWRSWLANLLGIRSRGVVIHYGAPALMKRWVIDLLPLPVRRVLASLKRTLTGHAASVVSPLQPLPTDASDHLKLLHLAWHLGMNSDANAPGQHVCYYELDIQGFRLPGERPWEPRWRMYRKAINWKGARVLELGCNLGLLGVFAMSGGAEDVLGVDADSVILDANRLVQQAFQVTYRTTRCDFNAATNWEDELTAFRPSIVTALSVLNWVSDKDRFVRFLGRFNTLLFEGHDDISAEITRLQAVGFNRFERIGRSERDRSVILAAKR